MKSESRLNVLFIDNYDSFVFNLVDEFEKRHCAVAVWRNDLSADKVVSLFRQLPSPSLVVLSPGPGTPAQAGCCIDLVRLSVPRMPIFGVCLGHQIMIDACGGEVCGAPAIVHGKSSIIDVDTTAMLFSEMDRELSVGRYHSLVGKLHDDAFAVSAKMGDVVMAVEHRTRPLAGVQFHPESILSPHGGQLIENVIEWAVRSADEGTQL